jgi:hypothetical protein
MFNVTVGNCSAFKETAWRGGQAVVVLGAGRVSEALIQFCGRGDKNGWIATDCC